VNVRAQLMMVMALDKCVGCHTCSITCKQAWTNRDGAEYMWWNNVETRPGTGYPRRWEDQERWQGGWTLDGRGRLALRSGGRLKKLVTIFGNLDMPLIDDYYEPWTYDYERLVTAPPSPLPPTLAPHSRLTGKPMDLRWGPNWDDDLAGSLAPDDPVLPDLEADVLRRYESVFMFYLPRICNHCLNPSCVASCPSGAMYKRAEDGVVLVDQDKCRGWRFCVSGCPYKKTYFNHLTGKAEKCIFCYPVTENGRPTVCSETCVGRLRYIGVVLYDLDAVTAAAETPRPEGLVEAMRQLLLDPRDPRVGAAAERDGVPHEWVLAAQRSPAYALAKELRVALPLHPEYRTLPMVWYVPPLSPVLDALTAAGYEADDPDEVLPAIGDLRVPQRYVAELLAAGDTAPVEESLRRLLAMRTVRRDRQLGRAGADRHAADAGMSADEVDALYRLLALSRYDERYVVPRSRRESAGSRQTLFGRRAAGPEERS
jgi:nitrate reductase beta subunit